MSRTSETVPHRRGHTRWLMVVPLSGLAVIVVGVVLLEALAPRPGPLPEAIEDLPPLAVDEPRACTRGDEQTVEDVREEQREATGRVGSAHIYACPEAYDSLPVVYVGEVIGELLPRRGGAWAQVNDDAYALDVGPLVGHRELDGFNTGMSVWLPDGLHERIEAVGRVSRRGDVVSLEGTVVRSDPLDGGGLTIRAESLEVLAPSIEVDDPLHVPQAVVAAILALAAAAAAVWARRSP